MKRKKPGESPMSKEVVLHETRPSHNRREPLLDNKYFSSRGQLPPTSNSYGNSRCAEVVGTTSAECAAVCCCCPCAVVNLLILAVYKLPAGIYKKAIRKKRRRRMILNVNGLPPSERRWDCGELVAMVDAHHSDKDILALEEEMWGKFYGSGFFRSPSQRSDVIHG
ncbi:hypothetical protein Leryth_002436 [Lithospermum erythrorhizon]|nr:hypothetical protein Leryth_002436 [Lithospermum erythrorhizon]